MGGLHISEDSEGQKLCRVAAIVLAAGCSRRMGCDNKLLMKLSGTTLVRSSVQSAISSDVLSTIVVLGHQASSVASALEGLNYQPEINRDYFEGMASSLRVGVKAAEGFDAVAIMLADMPQIASGTLNALLAVFMQQDIPSIVVATHEGRRGHPVIWPAVFFPELMALRGDIGGKQLLEKYSRQVVEVDVGTDSIFMDIDLREDLLAVNSQPVERK